MSTLLDAALDYAARGWAVLPLETVDEGGFCSCGDASCESSGKHPRTRNGLRDASADASTVREWWKRWPDANIGIACAESGFVAIDIDPRHGGDGEFERIEDTLGRLPHTIEAATGGNGRHILLRHPGRALCGKLASGVELKANGYIVADPSLHASGRRYSWQPGSHPAVTSLAAIPEEWLAAMAAPRNGHGSAPPPVAGQIIEGERNATLTSLAGTMRRRGLSHPAIEAALLVENAARCRPPLDDREVSKIAESIARYAPAEPLPKGSGNLRQPRALLTDTGNAQRFAEDHRARMLYVPGPGWHECDGRRWAPDEGRGVAIEAAKRTARGIRDEAGQIEDGKLAERVFSHGVASEHRARLEAMVKLAQSDPALMSTADQLDSDPYLLNVQNGTLDLRTGALRAHDPTERITKLAPVAYDPDAHEERWDTFIDEVCGGDDLLAGFLRRAVGYSLTGDTCEEVLFFAHGPGATGKSTFLETIKATFGDYATTASFDTFLSQRSGRGPRDGIAQLAGARIVTSAEVDDGQKLAESVVKQLTGGDKVRGSYLYRDSFEFRPQFKLWLAANRQPRVDALDDAVWRRIRLVPFVHVVALEDRDKRLKRRLQEARGAVLAWAVKGCLDWQRDGLGEPPAVLEATAGYRVAMDPIGEFITECCDTGPGCWAPSGELWAAYEAWSDRRPPITRQRFIDCLRGRGFTSDRTKARGRFWAGIGLAGG